MQPRPRAQRHQKLSFWSGRTSVHSQLFPGVLISCVSKLLCLIKDVTMTFPHIHKLRLCINIFLFALTCEWFSSKLKMKSPAWVRHHSFQLIRDLSIPSASNGFWGFPNTHRKLMETQSCSYLDEEVSGPQASFPCHPSLIHRLQILQSRERRGRRNSSMGVSAKIQAVPDKTEPKERDRKDQKTSVLVLGPRLNLILDYKIF